MSIPSLREAVRYTNAGVVVTGVDIVDDLIRRSFSEERFRTVLITLFSAISGVLAVVGMYGVTARAVAGRTRELSIRVALGASTGSVVRMIMGRTLAGVVLGVGVGTLVAMGANRVLIPYLFGVNVQDPIVYAATVGGLAAVSIVTSWIPARRAGRVAPAAALRGE